MKDKNPKIGREMYFLYFPRLRNFQERDMKLLHKYLIRGILAGVLVSGPALAGLSGDGQLDAVYARPVSAGLISDGQVG